MAENWYIVLELEFDPNPVQDQAVIEQKIDEKAKFWSSKFNDFNKGAEYRKYHQMIPDIRKAMSDPAERKRLIDDAIKIKYAPVDKLLEIINATEGYISSDQISKLAMHNNLSIYSVEKRVAAIGLEIKRKSDDEYRELYNSLFVKPQNYLVYENIKPILKSFHAENLYVFLNVGYDSTSFNELCQKAQELKKNKFNKTDSVSGSGSKLCGHCELVFRDQKSKNAYDEYLRYIKCTEIIADIRNILKISDKLTKNQYEKFLYAFAKLFSNEKAAEDILQAIILVEKIDVVDEKRISSIRIKNIRSFISKNINVIDQKHTRQYSSSINKDIWSAIYFQIELTRPIGIKGTISLGFEIYDELNNNIAVIRNEVSTEYNYDEFVTGWIVSTDDSSVSLGHYLAKVWIDDSDRYEYKFSVVETASPPTKDGLFSKLKKIIS